MLLNIITSRLTFDRVIRKIRRVNFFETQCRNVIMHQFDGTATPAESNLTSMAFCRGVARIFGLGGRRYHVGRSLTQRAPKLWSPCGVSGFKTSGVAISASTRVEISTSCGNCRICVDKCSGVFMKTPEKNLSSFEKKSVLFALGGALAPPCPL